MIWPTAAAQLALTKLKTRKVRLAVTLVIAGLLFSIILAASFVIRGAVTGIEKFSKTGFGDRYIAAVNSNNDFFMAPNDPDLIAKAESMQKKLQEQKTAEAKRLGLQYDPKTDTPYVQTFDTPGGKQKILGMDNPVIQAMIAKHIAEQPGNRSDLDKLVKNYGAKATYTSLRITGISGPPYLQVLKDNKEDFDQQRKGPSQNGIDSLPVEWQLMDGPLMKPFILSGQNLQIGDDGSVPVVAPFSAAEQILGIKSLPSSATADQRLERLKEIRKKAAGFSFLVCYRNSTSASEVQSAIAQQLTISQTKGTKGYRTPDFIQDKPAKACGPVVTTRDVRTADAKKQAANQQKFDQEFGQPAAESHILKLRIVGLNSDLPQGSAAISVVQIFQAILQSSLGSGWFTPTQAASDNPALAKIFNADTQSPLSQQYYAEFNSPTQLKKFLDEQNCQPTGFGPNQGPDFDPYKSCKEKKKYFSAGAFGSSSTALDEFKKGFTRIFTIAAAVVAALAAIIMMGTVGRIIADSRRETAVFRAIGAKRSDIAQIYFTYVIALALLIIAISLVAAYIIAYFVNKHYSETVTIDGLLAFNVSDLSQKIVLSRFYLRDVLLVGGLVLAGAILSAVFPILNNLRRNPIRDMRDER